MIRIVIIYHALFDCIQHIPWEHLQALVPPAGYNEPDVEWRAIDEETLQRIENGEEDINGLYIEGFVVVIEVDEDGNEANIDEENDLDNGVGFIVQPWADAERIGNAIANSRHLLKFFIQEFCMRSQALAAPWLFDVFRGLARNRSIEHLEIFDVF